jgi:predicted transporter
MMLLGIFYLLGAMLIPAYMQTKQMNFVSTSGEESGIVPLLICGVIALAGFLLENLKRSDR